ncbi:class I SAM-dependent methyltransferase [Aureisphaera galaxeae]|uniref:O-methyltransferase n=1 Tax=Aureisphaera galaxeae TaxID=1538023 RepID=UPI0023500B86|nr:class I SAM-dependent methyltransferase [Aureisphaera galaxeae]MDC8006271.1 class I SAM-dependent methyltransferase [Aureisphaera galaxeae]
MWYLVVSYIKYLLRSRNEHSVHSPFVFQLATQCFYDRKKYAEYELLKQHRSSLLQNKDRIEVKDFGAGSRVFKGNEREVSKIARNAGITRKRQQLLFRLAKYFQPKEVLELGTSVGLGTVALASGNADSHINTVEGCHNTAQVAKAHFKKFKIENIQLYTKDFDAFFEESTSQFDLVYIDGNHSKKSTLHYFDILLNRIHNDSILVFDDIYWSPDMTAAWEIIRNHEKVTVSIDTFQWGMVFFRKEQPKQHFTLRL